MLWLLNDVTVLKELVSRSQFSPVPSRRCGFPSPFLAASAGEAWGNLGSGCPVCKYGVDLRVRRRCGRGSGVGAYGNNVFPILAPPQRRRSRLRRSRICGCWAWCCCGSGGSNGTVGRFILEPRPHHAAASSASPRSFESLCRLWVAGVVGLRPTRQRWCTLFWCFCVEALSFLASDLTTTSLSPRCLAVKTFAPHYTTKFAGSGEDGAVAAARHRPI